MSGAEYSWQKLFEIKKDDLIFSNLMAWEKAIAVASPEDAGCVGNHRMLTCEVNRTLATPNFLLAYFKTEEGFMQIRDILPEVSTLSSKSCPRSKFPYRLLSGNAGLTVCRGRFSKLRHYGKVRGRMWRGCCRQCCMGV